MAKRKCNSIIVLLLTVFTFMMAPVYATVEDDTESSSLSASEAFQLKVKDLKNNMAECEFNIAPGYLLYQKHFKFKTLDHDAISIPDEKWPKASIKRDDIQGDLQVYKNNVNLSIPLSSKGLLVSYQGCSDNGFCYSPLIQKVIFDANGKATVSDITEEEFDANPDVSTTTASTTASSTTVTASSTTAPTEAEHDRLTNLLHSASLPMVLFAFFGVGLLLAFTPCVLPMVPILINILVGEDHPLASDKRTFILSSLYILSAALSYAIVGALAGLMGAHLQNSFQNPYFLIPFSFILFIFALNQFNILHVQMPRAISNVFSRFHFKHKEGSYISAIMMGGLSALMVSPCITPALVGALTYIAQTGNVLLGGLALFVMALGMGLPLLVFALVGGHFLPKAGSWMTYIKGATGGVLMVLAVSILMRAFPAPINVNEVNLAANQCHGGFTLIHNEKELTQALAEAKATASPVVLDVYADWCISCKSIDKEVFGNQLVMSTLQRAKLLRLDLTKQNSMQDQLQKRLGIIGPPTLIFFDLDGNEAKQYRLIGTVKSEGFINHYQRFLQTHLGNKDRQFP